MQGFFLRIKVFLGRFCVGIPRGIRGGIRRGFVGDSQGNSWRIHERIHAGFTGGFMRDSCGIHAGFVREFSLPGGGARRMSQEGSRAISQEEEEE